LRFTTKISTTKRPYAYILVYTPTPRLILAPHVKGWKRIRPLTGQLSAFRILPTVPQ